MTLVRYLTHPEVMVDPSVPIPEWGLSPRGRTRVAQLVASGLLDGTTRILSSAERKAVETAEPIAAALGLRVEIRPLMHENDRSSTGYLPRTEFEAVADLFFADPMQSVRGWERSVDAQARIVAEVRAVLNGQSEGDVLIVGHGGVGTLLRCHLADLPIDRRYDQPDGGGCLFEFDWPTATRVSGWHRIEEATGS